MKMNEFCYWLRGYFELSKSEVLTPEQVVEIKRHLDLCFNQPILQGISLYQKTPSDHVFECRDGIASWVKDLQPNPAFTSFTIPENKSC